MKRYFSIIAILALAACAKEIVPDGGKDASLRTEALKARIATTKVEISDAGKFSWTAGDEIAVHRSANGYETAVLTADGCFNVHLAEGEARDGYAVYPASVVDADAAGLTVNLPAAYTIPKEGMGTYSPLPMVALNDPDSEDLLFHHLGGIIRLVLDTVPFETQQIVVNLGKKVTGSFVVADADTDAPYISLSAGAAEDIVYTLSSPVASTSDGFTLNIPVPLGDYESVSLKVYDRYGHLVEEKEESMCVSVGRADGYEVDSELKVDVSVIPLCLKLARKGTVSVENKLGLTMEYSLDNETWTSFSSDLNVELDKGGLIYFRGNNAAYSTGSHSSSTHIICSAKAYLYGNIMSLITPLPEDFSTLDVLTQDYTFNYLFYDEEGNPISPRIVNHPSLDFLLPAKTLSAYCYDHLFYLCGIDRIELPATTMAEGCYRQMFEYCRFVNAPVLPATTLAKACYDHMFEYNGLLVNAPELPARTLAEECYSGMFYHCTALQEAPELPVTELEPNCYHYMFNGCTSLTTTPSLPATTVPRNAYQGMFRGCSSLTTITDFPATTLGEFACQNMFEECTALESFPDFQVVNLENHCCAEMFQGCTSLVSAPALPATSLAPYCYRAMFKDCSSLNHLKAMFTTGYDISEPLTDWLSGVSETGTFEMNDAATYDPVADAGVPSTWTINRVTE